MDIQIGTLVNDVVVVVVHLLMCQLIRMTDNKENNSCSTQPYSFQVSISMHVRDCVYEGCVLIWYDGVCMYVNVCVF